MTQSRAPVLRLLMLFAVLSLHPGLPDAGPRAQEIASDAGGPGRVAALGRLEPRGGIVRVAAPSTPLSLAGSVVSRLLVGEGEDVQEGQLLAVTDAEPALEAAVAVAEAELHLKDREAEASLSRADEACVIADVLAREAARRDSLLERNLASREEAEQSLSLIHI